MFDHGTTPLSSTLYIFWCVWLTSLYRGELGKDGEGGGGWTISRPFNIQKREGSVGKKKIINILMLRRLLCMVNKEHKYGWFTKAVLVADVAITENFF